MVEQPKLYRKLEETGRLNSSPAKYVLSVVRQEKDTNGIKFGKEGNKKSNPPPGGCGCRVRSLGDACPHYLLSSVPFSTRS